MQNVSLTTINYICYGLGSRLGVLEWSWAVVLERKFGVEQEMQVNTFLDHNHPMFKQII